MTKRKGAVLGSVLAVLSLGIAQANEDTGRRIVNAESDPQNWLSTGRDYQETRNSPLSEINASNVRRLKLAWFYTFDTSRGQEATPLAIDGVVYTTSAWSKVQALDAASGKLLWQFDPHVPGIAAGRACCDVVNRGVAYWNGKVYVGTIDGRLIAIDAKSGKLVWSVVTCDFRKGETITGAPRVVKGKVIIGFGGAEMGVRGYLTAYDAETGSKIWRFYLVPGNPAKPDHEVSDAVLKSIARPTWTGQWWKEGGGGATAWDSFSYDPELDLLFVGTGNASYWDYKRRSPRGGSNLFTSSIVALRPDTGKYVWRYQETPGDQWDYDACQNMILTDIVIDGSPRKVLFQAPKNGFFYVLDRATGKLISAKPYGKVTWAKGVDLATGRPILNPDADYSRNGGLWTGFPGGLGAHEWAPMAFNSITRLVYIPVHQVPFNYEIEAGFEPLPKGENTGVDWSVDDVPVDPAALASVRKNLTGGLLAWDPVAQKMVWRAPLPGPNNGGVLSTNGNVVFEGDSSGRFHAFDARSGRELWSFDAQGGIIAAPVTYSWEGRQYVTVLVGWGGSFGLVFRGWVRDPERQWAEHGRVLTFSLDGAASLPPVPDRRASTFSIPEQFGSAALIAEGRKSYFRVCYACHGPSGGGGGVAPNIRRSTALGDRALFSGIVLDGALADQGMISFKEDLSPHEVEAIRSYIIDRAVAEAASIRKGIDMASPAHGNAQ